MKPQPWLFQGRDRFHQKRYPSKLLGHHQMKCCLLSGGEYKWERRKAAVGGAGGMALLLVVFPENPPAHSSIFTHRLSTPDKSGAISGRLRTPICSRRLKPTCHAFLTCAFFSQRWHNPLLDQRGQYLLWRKFMHYLVISQNKELLWLQAQVYSTFSERVSGFIVVVSLI